MSHFSESDKQKVKEAIAQLKMRLEADENYSSLMTQEDEDFIWVGTYNGLYRFSKTDFSIKKFLSDSNIFPSDSKIFPSDIEVFLSL